MIRDDHTVDANLGRTPGVLAIKHALDQQAPVPVIADPGDVIPSDARVKLRGDPIAKCGRARGARHGPLEVTERQRFAPQRNIPQPARMSTQVESAHEPRPQRQLADHRVAHVAVTGADDGEVDRQNQHRRSDRPARAMSSSA